MDNNMFNSSFNTFGQQSYNAHNYGIDTNVVLVTSLEEAIMRTTRPNSERVYFHQTLPVFYRVKVDFDGRKSYQEFPYGQPDVSANTPVIKSDLQPILARLEALEGKIIGEVVTADEKSNG